MNAERRPPPEQLAGTCTRCGPPNCPPPISLSLPVDHHREESHQSRLSEKEWRERVDAFQVAMEQQRENTLDITSDMSRQYKAMQEQLIKRNDQLEKDCKHLTAEVKQKDEEIGELRGELDMSKKDMEVRTWF